MKNPKVVFFRSLKERKGRDTSGCFLAEGRKMTAEALSSGLRSYVLPLAGLYNLVDSIEAPVSLLSST